MSLTKKDLRWLTTAGVIAYRFSTCTRRQYAAIIVGADGRIISTGYNGSPPGYGHCNDGACPHANDAPGEYTNGCIAIHAESNALLYSDIERRKGATLYVNGVPCYECAKLIAGSGIERVVFVDDGSRPYNGTRLLADCGIILERTYP